METVRLRTGNLFLFFMVLAGSLALTEFGRLAENRGALLGTLALWAAFSQGCIAVAAASDLTGARWIGSLRRELLAVYPLLPFLALLFLLVIPLLDLYPWAESPNAWLNKPFFLIRNGLLLVAAWLAARRYLRHALSGSPETGRSAVIYLLVFVASQSLVAYDWVMSLEYPWFSTMFAPLFFVEAFFAGLALAGLALFFLFRTKASRDRERTLGHLGDIASLTFGFSILWGGLFFAQYLLLWYGNLPEEVHVIQQRITAFPFGPMIWAVILLCFAAPFLAFLSHRAKQRPGVVALVGFGILLGILLERLFFIMPAVPLHAGILMIQNVLLFATWMLLVNSHGELLPWSEVEGPRSEVRGPRSKVGEG